MPTREFLKHPDMPIGFSGDSAKVFRTAEFYQVDFRNVIHIVSLEWFKMSFLAPIIDRCRAVTDYFWNFGCGHHIWILRKKFCVIQFHIFKNLFGYFGAHFDGIVPLVPTCRFGIGLGKYFSLFKICNNIRFFDFVTASFLARVFARYLAVAKQIQSRWFADVAYLIELVFGNNTGNRIPVDCSFIHSNTPRKYFSRCWSFLCIAVVDVFILFFPQFFPK